MFVFVYIHHTSFPHLVVILTTLGSPKSIFCFNSNIMNDNSKQDHPGKNKFGCTLFTELHGQDTQALPRIFRFFWIPNKSLLKSSHPKKYLPNFPTKKIPELKISNPKESLDHSRHLKSGIHPPPGLFQDLCTWTALLRGVAVRRSGCIEKGTLLLSCSQ